jgi:hypothetical protein
VRWLFYEREATTEMTDGFLSDGLLAPLQYVPIMMVHSPRA